MTLKLFSIDAPKKGTKRQRNESASEKLVKEKTLDPTVAVASDKAETTINNNESAMECDIESSFNSAVEEAVNTLLSLTKQENNEEKTPEPVITEVEKEDDKAKKKQQEIDRIKKGWTAEDCGTISIGELYLMVPHLFFSKKKTVF